MIVKKRFVEKLSKILSLNEESINRFLRQFSDEISIAFLDEINPSVRKFKSETVSLLKLFSVQEKFYFLKYLTEISLKIEQNPGEKILLVFIEQLFASRVNKSVSTVNKVMGLLQQYFEKLQPDSILLTETIAKVIESKNDIRVSKNLINRDLFETIKKGSGSLTHKEKLAEKVVQLKDQIANDKFLEPGTNEVLVSNAGLILLHPFLKYFFIELGIVDENGQFFENKKNIAVQALHYLATASENVYESSLVFEKFICAVPLKNSLPKKSILTKKIKEESENLLTATIKNWPELKSTSADGLRELFIQRKGKLVINKGRYKLIVERKPQDILLEKLNWNISVIKFPWKKDLLMVDW